MATNEGNKKCCKYCWRPTDCPPGPPMTHHRFHNEGCPIGDTLLVNPKDAMAEWERGWAYGFDDNYIEPHRYRYYTTTFILGWRVGKAEIDHCVECVVEDRYFQ